MTDLSTLSAEQPYCRVEYDACNRWVRATWQGFVNPQQALQGLTPYISLLKTPRHPAFLNDNSQVLNPWFDSLTWLRYAWESTGTPPPICVAHVMQPGSSANLSDLDTGWTRKSGTHLQLFESVRDAEDWLRSCNVETILRKSA